MEDNITVVQQSIEMMKLSLIQKKQKVHPQEFEKSQNSSSLKRL